MIANLGDAMVVVREQDDRETVLRARIIDLERDNADCRSERAAYGDKMTARVCDLETEVEQLTDRVTELSGRLAAQTETEEA